jgi:hypothetical protein
MGVIRISRENRCATTPRLEAQPTKPACGVVEKEREGLISPLKGGESVVVARNLETGNSKEVSTSNAA